MKARTYILDGRPIPVTISDAAIEEWLTVRAANRKAGYPDRPPDIDTPSVRAWRLHPGDPGYRQKDDFDIALETLVSTVRDQPGAMLVAGKRNEAPNKVFVKVRQEQSGGGFATKTTLQLDGETWREMKADFTTRVEAQGGTVRYTSPSDFEVAIEMDEVDAAIAEWYRERAGVDESHSGV